MITLEHAPSDDCWCAKWEIRWNTPDKREAYPSDENYTYRQVTYSLVMRVAADGVQHRHTVILFSHSAWSTFCKVRGWDADAINDGNLWRVMTTWGACRVVRRHIAHYEQGEMKEFRLPEEIRLTTVQGSTYHVDDEKAREWLRRWGLT
jgi:hypothetical protein